MIIAQFDTSYEIIITNDKDASSEIHERYKQEGNPQKIYSIVDNGDPYTITFLNTQDDIVFFDLFTHHHIANTIKKIGNKKQCTRKDFIVNLQYNLTKMAIQNVHFLHKDKGDFFPDNESTQKLLKHLHELSVENNENHKNHENQQEIDLIYKIINSSIESISFKIKSFIVKANDQPGVSGFKIVDMTSVSDAAVIAMRGKVTDKSAIKNGGILYEEKDPHIVTTPVGDMGDHFIQEIKNKAKEKPKNSLGYKVMFIAGVAGIAGVTFISAKQDGTKKKEETIVNEEYPFEEEYEQDTPAEHIKEKQNLSINKED